MPRTYTLKGRGFNAIPNDAKGLKSFTNDRPLMFKDTTDASLLYSIVEKSDNEITLEVDAASSPAAGNFLGGIVSADRQTIYWENTTMPVP